MTSGNDKIPPFVTFSTGAELLDRLGIAPGITGDGVRYIARSRPDWPFSPGRAHPYLPAGNARGMATGPFLSYSRTHPTSGRGPDRKPRKRKGDPE